MMPDNPLMLISILDFLLTLPSSTAWLIPTRVIERILAGVFNAPAVKTSRVNRQLTAICFFMIAGLIVQLIALLLNGDNSARTTCTLP